MKTEPLPYKDIDEYILQFPREIQEKLRAVRNVIREAASDATERISYRMPAYFLRGNLVYFAAFKNHIGFYPTSSGTEAFQTELAEYAGGKGSVRFPFGKPLPLDLIRRIIEFRAAENRRRAES